MSQREIAIHTGLLCNNLCRFCPYPEEKLKQKKIKSLEDIVSELKIAKQKNQNPVFTGGEPTIRKDFLQILKEAKNLGFRRVGVKSNGRMFSYKNFCQAAINAGANLFIISFPSNFKLLHEWLTFSSGSFEQTIQGIKNLKLLNQKVFSETIITKSNYSHLAKIAEFLIKLKVDQLHFKFPLFSGQALKNSDSIIPNTPLVAPYLKGVEKVCRKAKKVVTLP